MFARVGTRGAHARARVGARAPRVPTRGDHSGTPCRTNEFHWFCKVTILGCTRLRARARARAGGNPSIPQGKHLVATPDFSKKRLAAGCEIQGYEILSHVPRKRSTRSKPFWGLPGCQFAPLGPPKGCTDTTSRNPTYNAR